MNHDVRFLTFIVVLLAFVATTNPALGASESRAGETAPRLTAKGSACIDAEETTLLDGINAYRAANGKGTVGVSQTLSDAAEHHAVDMGVTGIYSHTLSDGSTWSENFDQHGYTYATYRGENLVGGRERARDALQAWKDSSTHNANLLNRYFVAVGISRVYVEGSQYGWYWVLTFGGKADAGAAYCGGAAAQPATQPTSPPPGTGAPTLGAIHIVQSGRTSNSSSSSLAYDRNERSQWVTTSSSAPSYAYIYFDLGASTYVTDVSWAFATGGCADRWRIQTSNDRSRWSTVANRGNARAGDWKTQAIGASARYVRFYFENPNKDLRLGCVGEVRFTG